MQNNYNRNVTYGGFFVRAAAYLIDSILVGAGCLVMRLFLFAATMFISDFMNRAVLFQFSFKDILLYLLGALYFILFTYFTGTTPGKRLMNLHVTGVNGKKPSLFSVAYRETVGRFLCGFFLCAGYLIAGLDREKRGLHDILADTRVVYALPEGTGAAN